MEKKYYPKDNSWTVNLTSCSNYPYKNNTENYLAGTRFGDKVKECIIVSEPFLCFISTYNGDKEYKMIMVNYNDNTYSVMYFEDCVNNEF